MRPLRDLRHRTLRPLLVTSPVARSPVARSPVARSSGVRSRRAGSLLLPLVWTGAIGVLSGCAGGARNGRVLVDGWKSLERFVDAEGPSAAPPQRPPPSGPPPSLPLPPPAPLGEFRTQEGVPLFVENVEVGRLTRDDWRQFNEAWLLFLRKDKGWEPARDAWLARGGAAPYVLAENLLRYFISATAYGTRQEIARIAVNAKAVGAPAVGYFANFLVLESWPLKEPAKVRGPDGNVRVVTEWRNDDVTRQQLAIILSAIGPIAVPRLASPPFLRAAQVSERRYVMYALGRIGDDAAIAAIGTMQGSADWQDRGSAAKALGFALNLRKNGNARPYLDRALADPDGFVRKKAEEALSGKTKSEF